jgi:glycosyltransferase involved in cell wall biosynthesis
MSEPLPKVSVITVYYNRAKYVKRTLESLVFQTFQDLEIIVVDDGSTDETAKNIAEFASGHPRITCLTLKNGGFTAAIRKGVEISRGDYIAICGSGDIAAPERIARQSEYLDKHDECGAVGTHAFHRNEVLGFEYYYRPKAKNDIVTNNVLTHGEVMFRRKLYDAVGGYREFFKYAQDRDLWFRMSSHTKFAIIPEILVETFSHKDSVTGRLDKRLQQLYYSDLAEQCHLRRSSGKPDLVDAYGDLAWIYRGRSPRLARKLVALAKLHLLKSEWVEAGEIVRRSLDEHYSLAGLAAMMLISLVQKLGMAKWTTARLLARERNILDR